MLGKMIKSGLIAGAALWCSLALGRGAPSGAHPPAAAPVSPPHIVSHAALAVPVNPHLHVTVTAAPKPAATGHPTPPTPVHAEPVHPGAPAAPNIKAPSLLLTHKNWAPRWDSHEFIASHRGTGTIRGEIKNPSGKAVNDARVALRKPGGRIIANVALRHITLTGTNGMFVMNNVRPGAYRVFASHDKQKGFVKVTVHAGSVENVSVKI